MFEATVVTDPRLAAAAALPPGPAQLAAVADLDPATLNHEDRLTLLELTERSRAAVDATQQRIYAALAYDDAGAEWVADEVALITKLSPARAGCGC